MNTFYTTILAIATFLISFPVIDRENSLVQWPYGTTQDSLRWDIKAAEWLADAQSSNGGWGAGSSADHFTRGVHVETDPATTAFAAMALLRAGGVVENNPYRKSLVRALDKILEDIEKRPANGKITALTSTQPQLKLGGNIDASMALEFLNEMRKQQLDQSVQTRIDSAVAVCVMLLEAKQNPDGSWADGGWAPVLQTTMSINALSSVAAGMTVSDSVMVRGSRYQANNYYINGIKASDAAGVPLYAASSLQRTTAEDAKEVGMMLDEAVIVAYKVPLIEQDNTTSGGVLNAIVASGIDKKRAKKMAENYRINKAVTQDLQNEEIWKGFGNNGGEEYLSYKMTSEALALQDKEELLRWKEKIEPKFKASQNPNGSWSGHHCITSPVFCTAAILQAWYAGN